MEFRPIVRENEFWCLTITSCTNSSRNFRVSVLFLSRYVHVYRLQLSIIVSICLWPLIVGVWKGPTRSMCTKSKGFFALLRRALWECGIRVDLPFAHDVQKSLNLVSLSLRLRTHFDVASNCFWEGCPNRLCLTNSILEDSILWVGNASMCFTSFWAVLGCFGALPAGTSLGLGSV